MAIVTPSRMGAKAIWRCDCCRLVGQWGEGWRSWGSQFELEEGDARHYCSEACMVKEQGADAISACLDPEPSKTSINDLVFTSIQDAKSSLECTLIHDPQRALTDAEAVLAAMEAFQYDQPSRRKMLKSIINKARKRLTK